MEQWTTVDEVLDFAIKNEENAREKTGGRTGCASITT